MTLSEDLALPLLQIKSSIELLTESNFAKAAARKHAELSALSAESGLQLVEAYKLLLSAEDNLKQPMEPVAIGAILDGIAHQLEPYAKQYNTQLQVSVQSRLAPVLAHQPSLSSALEILGSSLIRAQAAQGESKHFRLVLGAHRTPD